MNFSLHTSTHLTMKEKKLVDRKIWREYLSEEGRVVYWDTNSVKLLHTLEGYFFSDNLNVFGVVIVLLARYLQTIGNRKFYYFSLHQIFTFILRGARVF